MRRNAQGGYALIVVMIFMHLFSLVSLFCMGQASRMNKMVNGTWQSDANLLEINQIMHAIEGDIVQQSVICPISISTANSLMSHDQTWWQLNACSGNYEEIRYYYVIEYLGVDACAKIADMEQGQRAGYYRLTVYQGPLLAVGRKRLLQTTTVVGVESELMCQTSLHVVQQGRQMWREID